MEPLKVQTQLACRYRIFDASGKLPFDVIFGLRRRSSQDDDPRDIRFKVAGSILDVPHALAHGLLKLCEVRTSESGSDERVEVDLTSLRNALTDHDLSSEFVILPSKGNRTTETSSSDGTFTAYHYRIHADSPLASLLTPGKKYSFGLAERDLGVHEYVDSRKAIGPETVEDSDSTCKLVSNPHAGSAVFQVVESLAWPQVTTRMHLLEGSTERRKASDESVSPTLEIAVTNTGSKPISVQTRGHQSFLRPWGVLQPEDVDTVNDRVPCIIDALAPLSCLQVVQVDNGLVVKGRVRPRRGCAGVTSSKIDLRPKVEDLLVLEPGLPVLRKIELDDLLHGLEDGKYHIQMRPEGCWWHDGMLEAEPSDDGKVPRHLMNHTRTPLMLETPDKVAFHIDSGKPMWDI